MCFFPISTRLGFPRRVKRVYDLFRIFPRFIEQRGILRVFDVLRCTGGVYDHRATVTWLIIVRRFFHLCRLRLSDDHFVYLAQYLRCHPFPEIHHQRWIKRRFAVVVFSVPTEILKICPLLNLECGFSIGIAVISLNDARTQRQAQRFCHVALSIRKELGVPCLNFFPWDTPSFLYPPVFRVQLQTHCRAEIRQTQLVILEFVN